MENLKIKRFDKSVQLPRYEKDASAFDFYCREGATIKPNEIGKIPSNVAIEIPKGHVVLILPRSSTPLRLGLMMPNSIGVIDPFYNGDENEIFLIFYNFTDKPVTVKKGDKIAQGLLVKYEQANFVEVDKLNKTKRKLWARKKID